MVCTITGTAWLPSGAVYPSATFTFVRSPAKVVSQDGAVVSPTTITVTSDVSGAVSFELLAGNYIGTEAATGVQFNFAVQDIASADWSSCVSAAFISPTVGQSSIGVLLNTAASKRAARVIIGFEDAQFRNDYASDTAFNDAATAAGLSFPSPMLARDGGYKYKVSLQDLGAVPDNSTSSDGAFQAGIDWLNGKQNGGTIYGGSFDPRYTNAPSYVFRNTVTLKPKVSILLGPEDRIRAGVAMSAMIDTATGSSNRLADSVIKGGIWNGNILADDIFRIRDFQNIVIGGDGMNIYAPLNNGLNIGDAAQSANSYGLFLRDLKITNRNQAFTGAPVGIKMTNGASDSRFFNMDIIGYAYGVQGYLSGADMSFIHTWSASNQGQHLIGFDLSGRCNNLSHLQVDEAYDVFYQINEPGTHMSVCRATLTATANDNLMYMVRLGVNATDFAMDLCTGNDRADARFLGMVTGMQADSHIGRGNRVIYGADPVPYTYGYPDTMAAFTVNAGSSPTVSKSINLASITRNGDADYTVTFANAMPDALYNVNASALAADNTTMVKCKLRSRSAGSFRIQTVDDSNQYITADKIVVSAGCFA